jgi:hypothetical protein
VAVKLKKKEVKRIADFVAKAQKTDPRIKAAKIRAVEAKEKEARNKEAKAAEQADKAAQIAAAAAVDAKASKAEREKQKKAFSKTRNIFRKLLRLAAEKRPGTTAGSEYGEISDADMEILCTAPPKGASFAAVNRVNDCMGGEAATKDPALFQLAGLDEVLALLARLQDGTEESQVYSK